MVCRQWIDVGIQRRRQHLDKHIATEHPEARERQLATLKEMRGE